MTIQFEHISGNTAVTVSSVDFTFTVLEDGHAAGEIVLGVLNTVGWGTVEDIAVGNLTLPWPVILGIDDTVWEGSGEVTLPNIEITTEVVVNNPYNIPSINFTGYSGLVAEFDFPSVSVSGIATQEYCDGDFRFKNLVVNATGVTPVSVVGNIVFPKIEFSGKVGSLVNYNLPKISIVGNGLFIAPGNGRFIFPSLTISGIAETPIVGSGDYTFPKLKIISSGIFSPVGNGNYNLTKLKIKGNMHYAQENDKTGNYNLTLLKIKSIATTQETSDEIIKFRRSVCSV